MITSKVTYQTVLCKCILFKKCFNAFEFQDFAADGTSDLQSDVNLPPKQTARKSILSLALFLE